jgi:uncharacterized short protein YbdD (DUF466 family)
MRTQLILQKLARVTVKLARIMDDGTGYEAYVRRCRADHPNLPVMTYEEFLVRQAASDDV